MSKRSKSDAALKAICEREADAEGVYDIYRVVEVALEELPFDSTAAKRSHILRSLDRFTKQHQADRQLCLKFGPGWTGNMGNHIKLGDGKRVRLGNASLSHFETHARFSHENRLAVDVADDAIQAQALAFAEWTAEQTTEARLCTFERFALSIAEPPEEAQA